MMMYILKTHVYLLVYYVNLLRYGLSTAQSIFTLYKSNITNFYERVEALSLYFVLACK